MAVRFVLGRSGTGKTEHCFRAIVEAMRDQPLGPPIYWLLPKQATFDAERDLTCRSGLGAFCRAQVVSFDQFGRDVFEDCGGTSIPEVTALGRQMIIGHLLRQNSRQLKFYSGVARQPGLAAELDDAFAEFERSEKSAGDLDHLVDELAQTNAADLELAPLLDKLSDVALIYRQYTTYLGQDRLDQHRRLMQVESSLAQCRFLRNARIFVDGFADFTNYERRILIGAAKAGAYLDIALLIDPASPVVANPQLMPDEMSLFRRTEAAYRRLHQALIEDGVEISEPLRLDRTLRFQSASLAQLESSAFRDPIARSEESGGIEMLEAPDRPAEVDSVARKIRELLMAGMRLREIGVMVRSLADYDELIQAAFAEHAIPCFLDRRRKATHHPLIEFIHSVFQIVRDDWSHDAVMSLLRSGLAGIDLYDADGLENYVLSHRIRGTEGWETQKPWDYQTRRLTGEEDSAGSFPSESQKAEALRKHLVDRLAPLLKILNSKVPLPVKTFATEIFDALDRFGASKTIGVWVDAARQSEALEQAAEHEQVWRNVVELFDELVELLGDEQMTPGEFYDVLEAGLDSFDLAITPQTVDQVLVGQVDRTRTGSVRAVFVLGLNEGEFPRSASDRSVLNDRDRKSLRARRIELDPAMSERLLDERLLAYIAMTRASERLFITRSTADDQGRSSEPSSFWLRIAAMFPSVPQTKLAQSPDRSAADIATPRQLVTALARWVRSSPDPTADVNSSCLHLYQWLATRGSGDDPINRTRYRAWRALSYSNEAQLSSEVSQRLFQPSIEIGVRQLETFAACPYQHFARFGLGLRARSRQEVTSQDLGRLYHDLLEGSLKDVMRRRSEGDRTARLEQVIDEFVTRVGAKLREEIMLGSARNRYLLERTRKVSRRIALAQRELLKRGSFRPTHVGITFGSDGNLPALKVSTPSGDVLLRGKIDRVDRAESTGVVAAIDYRLSATKLPVGMVKHGLTLQLLSHLLVLEANGQKLSGRSLEAAGAFYHQLIRKIEDVDHPDECVGPTDPAWHLKLKPRGLFDLRVLPMLDRDLTTGTSQVVQVFIKKDGSLGRAGTSDAAESNDFRDVLNLAAKKLTEIATGMLSGRIEISPYRLNDNSPCVHCDYRSVCRFDPAINRYNFLSSESREEVLGRATDAAAAGGAC